MPVSVGLSGPQSWVGSAGLQGMHLWPWHCRNALQLLKAADFLALGIPQGYSDKHCNLFTLWAPPEAHKYQQIVKILFSIVTHSLGTMDVICPISMTVCGSGFPLL